MRTSRIQLRDVNWLGDIAISEAIERHAEIYVKVRSTRPPQAAWLHRHAEADFEVELIGGEDGRAEGGHTGVPWGQLLGNTNLWILCAMYFCAAS